MVRQVIRALTVLAAVAVGLVGAAPPAAACSCASFNDDEALAASQVAFVGELLEVRTPSSGEAWSSADPERFVFAVDRVYKGEANATQSVVTAREGASCGLELMGRGPFLVFATTDPQLHLDGDDGEVYSSLCSGSRELVTAPVPSSFGDGQAPFAGSSPIGRPDDDALIGGPDVDGLPIAAIVVASGLLVLVLLTIVALRRRLRPDVEQGATAPTS